MSAKPRDLGMTPLDDLFSTDESRAEAQLEKVVTLNPADISDFPNHPFKVKQDEAMAEMVDSVKQYGVLVPALVRPKADGGYEMVAGHRRKCAAMLAGMPEFYENAKKTEKITDDTASTGRTDMLRPDVIVVDPPRKGCDEKCLDTMLAMSPERIVYVSCDSATLARDLKILCEEKYELMKCEAAGPFGQREAERCQQLLHHLGFDG